MSTDTVCRFVLMAAVAASMAAAARGAYPLTTDSNCHCYKTNATTADYFSHHQFFDFRSLSRYVNVTKPLDNFDANAQSPPASLFFTNSKFANAWAVMSWNNTALLGLNNSDINDATVPMVNSPNNIYIEQDGNSPANRHGGNPWHGSNPWHGGNPWQPQPSRATHLTLRTVRHATFQSSAEFESLSQGYQFLSLRMHARTKGAAGAVTAMFTYRPPPTPHNISLVQEADLEIRTRDPPRYVQYTNQPAWNATSDIPDATRNVTLPGGRRWSDWAEYRMDWTPGSSTWYVNGQLASRIEFQAPRDPALVIFNAWSDGGSWSGDMRVGTGAYLQIRWIEMVYNSTDPGRARSGMCKNVCSIDETSKIGTPVLISGGKQQSQPQDGPAACISAQYGQCAGKNWNGCRSCAAKTTCQYQNDYYSQCL